MAGCGGKKKYKAGGKHEAGTDESISYQNYKNNVAKTKTGPQREIGPSYRKKDEERNFSKKTLEKLGRIKKGNDKAKDEAKNKGPKMNEGMKALKKKAPEVAAKIGFKNGGKVKSHRGDGCAMRGKTKGRMV